MHEIPKGFSCMTNPQSKSGRLLSRQLLREDLIDDPRFATGPDRVAHEKELDAIIGEWTRRHDKREAMEKLIAVGVPSGAVKTVPLEPPSVADARGAGVMPRDARLASVAATSSLS